MYPNEDHFDGSDLDSPEEDPFLGLGVGLLGGLGLGVGLAHLHRPKPVVILPVRAYARRPWCGGRRRICHPKIHVGHKRFPHSFRISLGASIRDEELLDDMLEDQADAPM